MRDVLSMASIRVFISVLLLASLNLLISTAFAQESGVSPSVIERPEVFPAKGRVIIEPAFQYTLTSRERLSVSGYTLFEAILIGRVESSKIERTLYVPSLTLRWGFKRFEVWGRIPWLYRKDQEILPLKGDMVEIEIDSDNIGDAETGIYYMIGRENSSWPDIVLNIKQKYRTGRDPYGLSTMTIDPDLPPRVSEFPTGSGHLGIAGGFSIVKTSDPAVLFFSVEYFYNIPRDVGIQGGTDFGRIDPGDSIEFGFGQAFALNERLSTSISYNQRLTAKTKQNGDEIVGSDINASTLNVGATYAMGRKSLSVSVGIGLTNDASDVDLQVRMPFTIPL